jgi:hypothetical protein
MRLQGFLAESPRTFIFELIQLYGSTSTSFWFPPSTLYVQHACGATANARQVERDAPGVRPSRTIFPRVAASINFRLPLLSALQPFIDALELVRPGHAPAVGASDGNRCPCPRPAVPPCPPVAFGREPSLATRIWRNMRPSAHECGPHLVAYQEWARIRTPECLIYIKDINRRGSQSGVARIHRA